MRVTKWGNSLAVRIPTAVVDALGLKQGDEIEITIAGAGAFEVRCNQSARFLVSANSDALCLLDLSLTEKRQMPGKDLF